MRQSLIGTADTCLARIPYSFDPDIPRRGSILRSMGTAGHASLAEAYLQRMRGDVTDPGEWDYEKIWTVGREELETDISMYDSFDWRYQPKTSRLDEKVIDVDEAWAMVEGCLRKYFDEALYWPFPGFEIVGVETPFRFPWKDHWEMSGTVDLIVQNNENGWLSIVDHKFSKKKWNRMKGGADNAQGAWYIHAIQKMFDTPLVTFVYDINTFDGTFERREAHRNQQQIDATLQRAELVAQLIDQGGPYPPNTASFLCSPAYCDYWELCPYGRILK
jgi:hypothetical protein